jgi:hypothetical protein
MSGLHLKYNTWNISFYSSLYINSPWKCDMICGTVLTYFKVRVLRLQHENTVRCSIAIKYNGKMGQNHLMC